MGSNLTSFAPNAPGNCAQNPGCTTSKPALFLPHQNDPGPPAGIFLPMKRSEPDVNLPNQPVRPGETSLSKPAHSSEIPSALSESNSPAASSGEAATSPDDTVLLKGDETPTASAPRSGPLPLPRLDRTEIPAILLEGDEPKAALDARAALKFAGDNKPEPPSSNTGGQELPDSYGTGRLLLTARDPRCLYAHWDLPPAQKQSYVELSADKQLVLRIHTENLGGPLITELKLDPGSGHSFVPVNTPGVYRYVADLGYYPPSAPWRSVASSDVTVAPTVNPDIQEPARFATMPFPMPSIPLANVAAIEPEAVASVAAAEASPATPRPNLAIGFPLPAPYKGTATGPVPPETEKEQNPIGEFGESDESYFLPPRDLSEPLTDLDDITPESLSSPPNPPWTLAQERALAELIGWSWLKQDWIDSAGISELIRGHQVAEVSGSNPLAVSETDITRLPFSADVVNAPVAKPGFWFNVQAELVIYGATEPDATVTIGGRPIPLRQDGSFSYRFALPDGSYQLPLAAVSTRGDLRQAELDFYRGTIYSEGTGSLAQNPELKAPLPENIR
jgi:hypothetical protein